MTRHHRIWVAVGCLLLLFIQTTFASRRLSLTYDEPIYTAIGYADLTTRDMRFHGVIGHPPLVNLLTAWPLLLDAVRPDPTAVPGWGSDDSLGFARAMLNRLGPLERVALVTRLPVMWLALLLAAVVYRWAQQAWGGWAGLFALGMFAFDPTVVAHAQLNTTDMGLTMFGFAGIYALARYLHRPARPLFLLAGLSLGAAFASKASGPFWLGAAGLVVFWAWLNRHLSSWGPAAYRDLGRWLVRLAALGVLALLVLWAAYLFEVRSLRLGGVPLPAASHWAGLSYIRSYMATGQTTFVGGRLVSGGSWLYFPLALLVKTPVPVGIGLLLAVLVTVRRGFEPRWSVIPLIVVSASYLFVAMQLALNIGHRHMLPLLPFATVFMAQLAGERIDSRQVRRRLRRTLLGGLLLWQMAGALTVFPHHLVFFNELAGGPDDGHRFLADSSVDWGQGFKALKRYLDQRADEPTRLAAFSSIDPAVYGLSFEPIPPTVGAPVYLSARFNPEPGQYVISAVPLQGIWVLDPDTYDWFRHRQPRERVGHALFVYDVPPAPAFDWVAQCAAPMAVLDGKQIVEGFGRSDLRLTFFDCDRSWHYPAGNGGWFVLSGADGSNSWATERLAGTMLSYRQRESWNHPAVTIYEQRAMSVGAVPPQAAARVAPSDWPLSAAVGRGTGITAPVSLEGPLTFLGYGVQEEVGARAVELRTYWRVEEVPARLPSLMAHLLAADGTAVAVGDGLGVPIEVWQPGDIIVQRHRLELPVDSAPGPFWLQTGAYWLDTQARWTVKVSGAAVGDRLLLTEVSR